jgi:hypothetical protein
VSAPSDYRQYAQECRELAMKMRAEHRATLLAMAAEWERLAQLKQRDPDRHWFDE